MAANLRIVIKDTEDTLFDGEGDRLSSFNEVGRFDVLPMHANFISMINKNLSIFKDNKIIKELPIEQAILKVKKDVVHIFVGIEFFALSDDLVEETAGGSKADVLKKKNQLMEDWRKTNEKRDKLKLLSLQDDLSGKKTYN